MLLSTLGIRGVKTSIHNEVDGDWSARIFPGRRGRGKVEGVRRPVRGAEQDEFSFPQVLRSLESEAGWGCEPFD